MRANMNIQSPAVRPLEHVITGDGPQMHNYMWVQEPLTDTMTKTIRKLLAGVVGEGPSSVEEDGSEEPSESFETPPMEEVLKQNQTADEL